MLGQLGDALSGVRVVDATRVLAGPFAAQLLADLGAEVVKVEEPGAGDETRGWGPPFDGDTSAYFLAANRGKRGVTLDLAKPEGRALFHALAAKADVVLENFRPSSAQKLGVTPEALHAVAPGLVVVSFSGFGRDGAYGGRPGYDFVVQAMSGMMAMNGPVEGPPCKFGVAIADVVTGLYAASAVLAALVGRGRTGLGYAIEVALIDCAVAAMANVAQAALSTGAAPKRQGNAHLQIVPYELYRVADGWLVLAVGNDGQWRKLCEVAGAPELLADPRFQTNAGRVAARDELTPRIARLMRERTAAAWEESLTKAGVPCGPLWDFAQLFASRLAAERKLKLTARRADGSPVTLVRSPLVAEPQTPPRAPPGLGEHTAEVLREWLGLGNDEITRLQRERIV